jgi:hypothetical protein
MPKFLHKKTQFYKKNTNLKSFSNYKIKLSKIRQNKILNRKMQLKILLLVTVNSKNNKKILINSHKYIVNYKNRLSLTNH